MKSFYIKYRNGINGTPVDWIPKDNVHVRSMSSIKRRIESKIKGESGLIGFDNLSIALRNEGAVYNAFNGNLSAVQRYIFEIYGIKDNDTEEKEFEGIADFSSISRPDMEKQIKFNIVDKLKALDILTSTAKQRTAPFNWKNRISTDYDFHNFYWGAGQTGNEGWSKFAKVFFKFNVTGVITPPTEDVSIYSNNASTFTCRKNNLSGGNGTITFEWTSGTNEPGDYGQLVKDYGGGDNNLNYSSREKICDVSIIASFVHNYGSQIAHTQVCLKKGETLRILDTATQEYKQYLVIDSWLAATPSQIAAGGVQTTWIRLYPADISWLYPNHRAAFNGFSPISDAYPSTYYDEAENYIDLIPSVPDIYGGYAINGFDALNILRAQIKKAWPNDTIVNRTGSTTFPISLDYYTLLIDEMPLGKHPYDAVKMLADSLRCYIFYNKAGEFVIQKRSRIGTDGTVRTLDITKKFSGTKNDFWDKLADGVKVTVKSGRTVDGVLLEGNSSIQKFAGIKPRNEITVEIIAPDTIEQTQSALDAYAYQIAVEILDFYGNRHSSYPIGSVLYDDILDWELIDRVTINSVEYFFETLDIDLFNNKASFLGVEITGHDYDREQVHIALSPANYASASGFGSSSSGGGSSTVIVNQTETAKMPKKEFTYQNVGQTDIKIYEMKPGEILTGIDIDTRTAFLINQIGNFKIYDVSGDLMTLNEIMGKLLLAKPQSKNI
ncbi:MAG: hypothetical protein FIA82_08140 [Melioribacter sp.]|nr:hypothetical protein [Melioribacter sp.]